LHLFDFALQLKCTKARKSRAPELLLLLSRAVALTAIISHSSFATVGASAFNYRRRNTARLFGSLRPIPTSGEKRKWFGKNRAEFCMEIGNLLWKLS
jgi:hypothetical protein